MKKKAAVFAPVKDETTYSPIWEAYYKRYFDKADIYYLDFGSENLPKTDCQIIHTERNILDVEQMIAALKETYELLFEKY